MDPLTHVFLPLAVCYAVRPDLFERPSHWALALLGLLPDVDKLFGLQGLLHSLPTLVPLTLAMLAVGRYRRSRWVHAVLAAAFLWSHIVLDLLQGNPVPWLYPFVTTGYGIDFPVQIAFGEGPLGVRLVGPPVSVHTGIPREGYGTFGLLDGYGVASTLAFLAIYLGRRRDDLQARG